jgi:hypothetical protein
MDPKIGFALAWISMLALASGASSPDSYQYINFGGKSYEIIGKPPSKKTPPKIAEIRNTLEAKLPPVLKSKSLPKMNNPFFDQAQDRLDSVDRSPSQRESASSYPRTDPATSSYGR